MMSNSINATFSNYQSIRIGNNSSGNRISLQNISTSNSNSNSNSNNYQSIIIGDNTSDTVNGQSVFSQNTYSRRRNRVR